ncbi:MAG: response regulator [Proteobacteria bacterium]|nr:response regulator [Pseudomonadota bacterium]
MPDRLLVIDIESSFRFGLEKRLQTEGFEIHAASEASEIKKIVKKKKVEVVLLNLVALKEKGLTILSLLKDFKPSLEVILLNRSDAMALSIKGMKLGAFDDFMLPFDFSDLLSCIHDALKRYRAAKNKKKPLLKRYEEMMIAITMAEAGSHNLAKNYLKADKRIRKESEESTKPPKTS